MIKYKSFAKEYYIGVKERNVEFNKAKITSPEDCYNYIKQFYNDDIEIYESFFALFLNRAHNVIGWTKISQGGIEGTVADIKLVAKVAIDCLCSAIVIAHNHPSGNRQPSKQDIEMTKKIFSGMKLLDIDLIDHIILSTDEFYFSFANEGMIHE